MSVSRATLLLAGLSIGMGITTPPVPAQQPTRTLVAVFAHADDERIVGPLLARYSREGARVVLVIATDGRKGVTRHAGIPAGDSLARSTLRDRPARYCATAPARPRRRRPGLFRCADAAAR